MMDMYKSISDILRDDSANSNEIEILKFAKQFEETYFNCKIEEKLKQALTYLYSKDFTFLEEQGNKIDLFYAVAEQYCRTKK